MYLAPFNGCSLFPLNSEDINEMLFFLLLKFPFPTPAEPQFPLS